MLLWYNGNKKGDSFPVVDYKRTKQKAIKLLSPQNFHGIMKPYLEMMVPKNFLLRKQV